jgi:hypothetical protein
MSDASQPPAPDDPHARPEQGALVDGCPHCRVLYPGLDPCPRCHGAADFRPVRMLDGESVRRAVGAAADDYDATRAALDRLLDLLHLHAPASLRALETRGSPSLERLRRDDAALPENVVGRSKREVRARLGPPVRIDGEVWEYAARGPSNHFRIVARLRFEDGRVLEQTERRVAVDCEHGGPGV